MINYNLDHEKSQENKDKNYTAHLLKSENTIC